MREITKSDFYIIRVENPRRKDKNVLIVADKVSSSSHLVVTPRKIWSVSTVMISLLNAEDRKVIKNLRECPRMNNFTRYELSDALNLDFSKGQEACITYVKIK